MARTKILVPPEKQCGYTSVIVSYSTGIDSTGAIYWATQNFAPEKIFLLYCDTGAEYSVNEALFFNTAKVLGLKPILLKAPKDFLYLLLNERLKFPDSKNRWCTAYLKTAVTDHWIRTHRDILGEKCLFISGERRDESRGRAKLPECEYHSTTLKTERKGKFECHWLRPVLDYEKGKMFEFGKRLGLDPHPCYEYIDRCSCMMCIFAKNEQVMENMKRHPEAMRKWVDAEAKLGFTWKQKTSLQGFKNYFAYINRPGADKLLAWLEEVGFFTAPASTKYHGAYAGGLVEHTNNVYRRLVKLADEEDKRLGRTYPEYTVDTIAVVALLHDVCKADAYKIKKEDLNCPYKTVVKKVYWTYTNNLPLGHGEKSVIQIMRFMQLSEEEMLAIRWHMGAFDYATKGGSCDMNNAFAGSRLAVMLHIADMEATHLDERKEKHE